MNKKNITGIVLAGGKSSRMGADKGLLMLKGKLFIEHILEALVPNVNDVMIIANNNYNGFGYSVYEDIIKDSGPLAGIYTGLMHSKTEMNMIVSCDIPLINSKLIEYIIGHSNKADIAFPLFNGESQPLCAVYSKRTINRIGELIRNNELKMRSVLKYFETKEIHITTAQKFYHDKLLLNINTPEELKLEREAAL